MKRSSQEDIMWDCSVCTYRNSPEAFKCLMCDVRKGTSTRKPRLNAELVAAQVAQVQPLVKPKKAERHKEKKIEGRPIFKGRPRLKNVDRSTAEHNAVTVNNVTVIITEFQPKHKPSASASVTSPGVSGAGRAGGGIGTHNTHSATNGTACHGPSEGGSTAGGGSLLSSEASSISDTSSETKTAELNTERRNT